MSKPVATRYGITGLLLPLVLSCGRIGYENIKGVAVDAAVTPPRIDSGMDAAIARPTDAGTDASRVIDAGADASSPTTDAAVCTVGCTDELADDPFGDNGPFGYVATHGGKLYFGPSADGSRLARSMPDGTATQTVDLTFPRDTKGALSRNLRSPPYSSIGTSGCMADTLACGPDNENGRGLLAAATLGGVEWLVLGGGRTLGDLDYGYMVADTTAPLALAFRYVDVSVATGPQTKGFSALHAVGDRLYMGFPDTGGGRPFLLALLVPPSAPGLDAVLGSDVLLLRAGDIPGIATVGTAMIDSISDFRSRVYIANSGAWARSNIEHPVSAPDDWEIITPSAAAYAAKVSVTTSKVVDLLPLDRAVPQIARYSGRLYVARNTTDGPQLWMCDPLIGGQPLDCDAGDWTLILANTSGDTQLSQFNNPANTSIGLLVATVGYLYVGFNNASGIVVFRSGAIAPLTTADFRGEADCSAASHPASCTGRGGPGLGNPSNTQILSSDASPFGGGTSVYVSAGSGTGGFRIHRVQ